jgi:hypothetical protein
MKEQLLRFVRFQFITVPNMKMVLFCDVAPCSLVEIYQRFIGAYFLHHYHYIPNDAGSRHHRNVGQFIREYMG